MSESSDNNSKDSALIPSDSDPEELSQEDIEELLEFDDSTLDDDERAVFRIARKVVTSKMIVSAGPLPPGSELAEYEAACSGAADRIIAMAERQSDHRMTMERRCLDGNIEADQDDRNKQFVLSTVGSVSALIICMTIVIFGGLCLLDGKSVSGFASIAIAIGSIGGIFAYTRKKKDSDNEATDSKNAAKEELAEVSDEPILT